MKRPPLPSLTCQPKLPFIMVWRCTQVIFSCQPIIGLEVERGRMKMSIMLKSFFVQIGPMVTRISHIYTSCECTKTQIKNPVIFAAKYDHLVKLCLSYSLTVNRHSCLSPWLIWNADLNFLCRIVSFLFFSLFLYQAMLFNLFKCF